MGGPARVLRGSLPAGPSPPSPPTPRHFPPLPSPILSPNSPHPSRSLPRSAPSPSPPAPSGALTAVSGLDLGGGRFPRRNPIKFPRSREGSREQRHRHRGSPAWYSPPRVKGGGPGAGDLPQLPRCLAVWGGAALRRPELPPP